MSIDDKARSRDWFFSFLCRNKIFLYQQFVVEADCIPLLTRLKEKPIASYHRTSTKKIFNQERQDVNNETPLHRAKSVEAAKILIEGGAEINAKNRFEKTPLTKALVKNRIEIAKFLIESGAAIEPEDEELMATIPELSAWSQKKLQT